MRKTGSTLGTARFTYVRLLSDIFFRTVTLVVTLDLIDIVQPSGHEEKSHMKKTSLFFIAITLVASGFGPAHAQQDLVYVAVEPCRVADTRDSSVGVVRAGTNRNFRVVGNADDLAAQGGRVDCSNPKNGERPVAVAAYIIAVPPESSSGNGVLAAYPSDQPVPEVGSGSTVNFRKDQVVGNTTIATICSGSDCPSDGELAVLARVSDQHVIVDVQGYFYPQKAAPGYFVVQAPFAEVNRNSILVEARCPNGRNVLSGGGNVVNSSWIMDGSYPAPDGAGWRVSYKSPGDTFSVAGTVWAICATVQ